ncbi:peptide-methionine (S)-S-oxide reductase MsrA [Kiloniella sp.]|uniref:peptide-methionine (S)-S-oxide reductase MsrA n=1 Tax=Kiloniella sp. TaxID=1938587 RepID=UPI003B01F4D7
MELATFGAGCFWGIETAFGRVPGVVATSVGFMGGRTDNPSYDAVCIGNTGHAEVVQVRFDPAVTSYDSLLDLFWTLHDPTVSILNDMNTGSQYRSVIFFHSPVQEAVALQSRKIVQILNRDPIATEIVPAGPYFLAEEYHQQYEAKQRRR